MKSAPSALLAFTLEVEIVRRVTYSGRSEVAAKANEPPNFLASALLPLEIFV
jgi:hypothetical protein